MKNAIIYTVLFAALQVVVSIVTQLVWNRLLGNSGVMDGAVLGSNGVGGVYRSIYVAARSDARTAKFDAGGIGRTDG